MSLISLVRFCAVCIASGFGSGFATVAPGTCGSAAALFLWWLFSGSGLVTASSSIILVVLTSVVGFVSIVGCVDTAAGDSDPSWIVIDEWAGLYVVLLATPPGDWLLVAFAFALFRLFDATKLGPVGWAENLPGAWGIMADDVVAGGLAALAVLLIRLAL